jgi:Class II flagellar assembly regulator
MTAIEGVGRPTTARIGSRAASTAESDFALPSEAGATNHASEAAAPQPASLASMLTLQELGGDAVEDREARRHGQDMLALLAALQRALLGASDPAATLEQLAAMAAAVPRATDRRLAAMVSAILVRVRVELARRSL